MKKKILISLSESHYIRNFITTPALNLLNEKYELYFIADKTISDDQKKILEKIKNFKGYFCYNKDKIKKFNRLNIQVSYINEKTSTSFKMLNRGIYIQNKLRRERESLFKFFYFLPFRVTVKVFRLLEYFYFRIFGNEKVVTKKFIDGNKLNSFIEKTVDDLRPDLIICPANGNKLMNLELVLICKKKKIKTFKICDNWDNPSSRSFINPKEDYIGVWGRQSFQHAEKINNYDPKNIFILGCARFDGFFTNKNKNISMFNFKYILLLENFINHGIENTLIKLDEIIYKNKNFVNTKIVYRPHPNRKDDNFINVKKFKNIIIDPQVNKSYEILNNKFIANLDYYPSLINNAEIIVAAPTSMIIEAMIFYKKTIVLGYDGSDYFNFKNFIKYNLHLHDLEKFPLLRINKNLQVLENQMEELNKIEINSKILRKTDNHRNYYLNDKIKYNMALANAVDNIFLK